MHLVCQGNHWFTGKQRRKAMGKQTLLCITRWSTERSFSYEAFARLPATPLVGSELPSFRSGVRLTTSVMPKRNNRHVSQKPRETRRPIKGCLAIDNSSDWHGQVVSHGKRIRFQSDECEKRSVLFIIEWCRDLVRVADVATHLEDKQSRCTEAPALFSAAKRG